MFRFVTLLISSIALIPTGCRQAPGPLGAGPLSPIGNGALAPVPNSAPSLNPFGGPTRVTPPGTSAFSSPNNYLGGVQRGRANNPGPTGGFAQASSEPIGSGVQVAAWSDQSANSPGDANQRSVVQTSSYSRFGLGASNPPRSDRGPRKSGMRVIDMTGAPNPPGYRPAQRSFTPSVSGQPQQRWQQPAAPLQAPASAFQTPPIQNPAFQNPAFQNPATQTSTFQDGVRTINIPARNEIADSALAPSMFPRTAIAPIAGPSTEPIGSGAVPSNRSQDNLMWRRPGAAY